MRGERRRAGAPLLRGRSSFIWRRGPSYPTHERASYTLRLVRIVSLVPSATEMLFALGLGDEVTAVTHECDHPPQALELPKVTRDVIGPGLAPGEIDRAVRELTEQGRAIYELDEAALRDAAARPHRHAGAVRRLRGLLRGCQGGRRAARPRAEGDLARPAHARRDARRRARAGPGHRRQGRRRRPRPGRGGAHRPREARGARRAAGARRGARVARPRLRRRPLDAAADRVRGRHRRARPPGRELRGALVGGGRRGAARGGRRDAVRLRRRARARGGLRLPGRAGRARRAARGGGRRRRVLLAPRPAARRRARAARAHPASGPRAGAGEPPRSRWRSRARPSRAPRSRSRRARPRR